MPFFTLKSSHKLYYVLRTPTGQNVKPSGLVYLLIHGLGSSSSFYGPVMPALLDAGHTCLAYDMYGSALSAMGPGDSDNTIQDHADDAAALLRGLDIQPEQVIVVGHSMGSLVATCLSVKLNVEGAVLIGGLSPSEAVSAAFNDRIRMVATGGMEPLADMIPTSATGSLSTPTHHAFIRALLLSQSPKAYMGMCRAIAEAKTPDYILATCTGLVIAGADDKVVSADTLLKISNWCVSSLDSKLKCAY